jgi:hypothetical protein
MAVPHLVTFFKHEFKQQDGARDIPVPGFRERVEEEIEDALLGPRPQMSLFGTDRAFVGITGTIPEELREGLASIPSRISAPRIDRATRLPAERTLRFVSGDPVGAVVFAAPVLSVHYRDWYSVLLLDRLITRVLPSKPVTALRLSLHPYYYRLEVPVPAGKFPEPVEEGLLQDIQRLQFARATTEDLETARRSAVEYLQSREVREWFSTQGIPERLAEGLQWVETLTADDVRTAARDLLLMNRVVATWPPKVERRTVEIEILNSNSAVEGAQIPQPKPEPAGFPPLPVPSLPAHSDGKFKHSVPERLPSGVFLLSSTTSAVYTATDVMGSERILVLTPPSLLDSARQTWTAFTGPAAGATAVPAAGDISTGDLAALFMLKTLLDRKLIEAGLWRDAHLQIDAAKGSSLQMNAAETQRALILDWIRAYAAAPPTEAEMVWAREAAGHQFPHVLPHLQALIWQRDPQGVLQDLSTVGPGHIRDVARIYFQ